MRARINPYRTQVGIFVPIALLELDSIGNTAKLLYGRLCLFAGEKGYCWPSLKTLAESIRVSRSSTKTAIKELVQAGLIEVEHRKTEDDAENDTNYYYFLDHPVLRTAQLGQPVEAVDRGRSKFDPPLGQNLTQGRSKSDPKKIHLKDSVGSSSKANKKLAAAGQSNFTDHLPAPPEILEAIEVLPLAHRPECLAVVMERLNLPIEVLTSNIQRLANRLAAPKATDIDDPAGWLKMALKVDYAAPERQAKAEVKAAKEQAAQRRQEEAEREERERQEELQRQAQLLVLFDQLPDGEREQIRSEAQEYCRGFGGESPLVVQAMALDMFSERYLSLSL